MLKSDSSDVDKLLQGISAQLDKVLDDLDQINRKVDRILDLIYALPRIVRGEVERGLVRDHLGQAKGIVGLIQDYSDPVNIQYSANRQKLDSQLDMLSVQLSAVVGVSGMSGVAMIAPYFTAWLNGHVALQKWNRKYDPSQPLMSPWKRQFTQTTSRLYSELFANIEQQDRIYDATTIPSFPQHSKLLGLNPDGSFKLLPQPPHQPPPNNPNDPYQQHYMLRCRGIGSQERLMMNVAPILAADWKVVTKANNSVAYAALEAFRQARDEVVTFYDMVPEIYTKKRDLLEAFSEPAAFWDVNN